MEYIFRTIEILCQIILVFFAGFALFAWKREIRGRDQYQLAKDLLAYIKKLRFTIYSKDGLSFHQVYLNDILINKRFYSDQILLIGKEDVYFGYSIFDLFKHINIRADIFLPKSVRLILDKLYPSSGKVVSSNKEKYTHIEVKVVRDIPSKYDNLETSSVGDIYELDTFKNVSIEEYFKQWENLLLELYKYV